MATLATKRMEQVIHDIEPEMATFKKQYEAADAQVMIIRDCVKKLLREVGLMTTEQLLSKYMGTHPKNRYGDMVIPIDVSALISSIYTIGFSSKALQDPTCFMVPPHGHPRRDECVGRNRSLIEGSGGLLAPFDDYEEIRDLSVTCGHTSQGFRSWLAGWCHSDERFTSDGRLSLRRLEEAQPPYFKAITEGVQWDRIHWIAEDHFPWVAELMQESGNASQSVARCESRLELMLKMAGIAERLEKLHGSEPVEFDRWERVEREALRAGTPFRDEIHGLAVFVRELSGGVLSPWMLHELRDFGHQCQTSRVVRGSVMQAVAEMSGKLAEGAAPLFRLALTKAMMSASDKYGGPEGQKLFKSTDLASLTNKADKVNLVLEAENVLQECRAFVDKHDVPPDARASLIGLTDVRVAHHVSNRPDSSRGIFKDLSAIGAAMCQEMASLIGEPVESPWQAAPTSSTEAQRANPKAGAVQPTSKVFDAAGKWGNSSDFLKAKGFTALTKVNHIKSKTKYIINKIDKESVHLQECNLLVG